MLTKLVKYGIMCLYQFWEVKKSMVLNEIALTARMPLEKQRAEIKRLKASRPKDVLFFAVPCMNNDVIETLLKMSGVKYGAITSPNIIRYYRV